METLRIKFDAFILYQNLTKHLQQHKAQLVGQRVRAVITCVLCQKPRCVYAQNALSKILKDEIINLEEDGDTVVVERWLTRITI